MFLHYLNPEMLGRGAGVEISYYITCDSWEGRAGVEIRLYITGEHTEILRGANKMRQLY